MSQTCYLCLLHSSALISMVSILMSDLKYICSKSNTFSVGAEISHKRYFKINMELLQWINFFQSLKGEPVKKVFALGWSKDWSKSNSC